MSVSNDGYWSITIVDRRAMTKHINLNFFSACVNTNKDFFLHDMHCHSCRSRFQCIVMIMIIVIIIVVVIMTIIAGLYGHNLLGHGHSCPSKLLSIISSCFSCYFFGGYGLLFSMWLGMGHFKLHTIWIPIQAWIGTLSSRAHAKGLLEHKYEYAIGLEPIVPPFLRSFGIVSSFPCGGTLIEAPLNPI